MIDEGGVGDHVDISSEHDTLPQRTAGGPRPGKTSWRITPRSGVTLQLGWVVLVAVLVGFFCLLLGVAWTTQALQPKLRLQAEERRRLNEEWLAVRATRRQRHACPRCGYSYSASDRDWHRAPVIVEDPPDDD